MALQDARAVVPLGSLKETLYSIALGMPLLQRPGSTEDSESLGEESTLPVRARASILVRVGTAQRSLAEDWREDTQSCDVAEFDDQERFKCRLA